MGLIENVKIVFGDMIKLFLGITLVYVFSLVIGLILGILDFGVDFFGMYVNILPEITGIILTVFLINSILFIFYNCTINQILKRSFNGWAR